MSGVKRVFVEKKKPFAVNAKELLEEIGGYLGIKTITDVRVLIRYDIENLSEETYKKALTTVFSEPPVDDVYEGTFPAGKDDFVFSVEYLPGQFDQRADSAEQCVKFFNENETPVIKTAVTYVLTGTVTDEEKNRITVSQLGVLAKSNNVLLALICEWCRNLVDFLKLRSLYFLGLLLWIRIVPFICIVFRDNNACLPFSALLCIKARLWGVKLHVYQSAGEFRNSHVYFPFLMYWKCVNKNVILGKITNFFSD
jgi:hypothetical protein